MAIHDPEHQALVKLLTEMRAEAGLTQAEVAGRLGMTQSSLSKYESGERRFDIVELRRMCAALGTDLPTLVGRFEGLLSER